MRLRLGHGGPAVVGQGEDPPAVGLGRDDQALVGEHLQRGVDRPGAGPPHAAAALGELGDDLVAVHRLHGEQPQDREAYVSATRPRPSTAASARPTATAETGAERGPEGGRRVEARRRAAMTVPAAAAARLVGHGGGRPALAALAVRAEGAELGALQEGSAAVAATMPSPAARGAAARAVTEGIRLLGAIGGAGVGVGVGRGKWVRGST